MRVLLEIPDCLSVRGGQVALHIAIFHVPRQDSFAFLEILGHRGPRADRCRRTTFMLPPYPLPLPMEPRSSSIANDGSRTEDTPSIPVNTSARRIAME